MFTVLMFQFEESTRQDLYELCSDIGKIRIIESNTPSELFRLSKKYPIDCFFFCLDKNFDEITRYIASIRGINRYFYTPLFLFSSRVELLVSAFTYWKICECFLLPILDDKREILRNLLKHYGALYQKLYTNGLAQFRIETPKGIYSIPHDDILFVESTQKKTLFHTKSGIFSFQIPLYRVRTVLPNADFLQTHRSYIINLKNACFVDKTQDPWVVSFPDYDQTAFVSRSYRKELLFNVLPSLDYVIDR